MRVRSIRNIAAGDPREVGSWAANATSTQTPTALTEAEAAQFIGMSAAWLKKSRTKRFRRVIDAPPFIRAGVKRVVYRVEDLEMWQERHIEHVGPHHPNDASDGLAISPITLRSEMAVG
jgi:predicted DNA-binding transcriptional regulator AlpA